MVKQRQDLVAAYDQGGRPELAQTERDEITVIQSFMPKQMTDEEAKAAVAEIIKSVGATSVKDMGKVMAELKAKFAGQMDMGKAGGIVKVAGLRPLIPSAQDPSKHSPCPGLTGHPLTAPEKGPGQAGAR